MNHLSHMMKYKDLQYSLGKIGADVRSQLASSNPLQKQDTKGLSLWIYGERNDLASLRTLLYQRSKTNKAFEEWTKEESQESGGKEGRDLEDIGNKLVKLLEKQLEIEQTYAEKNKQFRQAIKAIREREEKLSDIREKKRSLKERIHNLTKSNPKSPKLVEFQKELESLERDTHDTEMEMRDFKRFALREAFYSRFNAMNEFAEKTAIIAGFGKYIVDLLDIEPTPRGESRRPYEKESESTTILADALMAVQSWRPAKGEERLTLAAHGSVVALHGKGKKPEVSKEDEGQVTTTTATISTTATSMTTVTAETTAGTAAAASSTVPDLPPRPTEPAGYSAEAVASVTGDAKHREDRNKDLEELEDLYDAPPPAYSDNRREEPPSSPRNSDEVLVPPPPPVPAHNTTNPVLQFQYEEKQADEAETVIFQSPYQAHAVPPGTPYSMHNVITSSPLPMHQQLPYHQNSMMSVSSQGSVLWTPGPQYYQMDYNQLYWQMAQRQQQAAAQQRPYAEFQQQFAHIHGMGGDPRLPYRQRVDPGGFRIPPAIPKEQLSAEEEKRQLAQRDAEEERRRTMMSSAEASQSTGGELPIYDGPQEGYPPDKKSEQ
ncbi:hypothetical protein EC973_006200 [Apophysomyces ossiformis]|uniref:Eisosome component PIL1-domain-containing protein n=1 Tax=Apophysomyces ossiformis TaxID=679940 RepID=A0A8H7EUM4_9FUNG|nr:hypothetical protein EC973_006200 [Apophysomyces ossiformis]